MHMNNAQHIDATINTINARTDATRDTFRQCHIAYAIRRAMNTTQRDATCNACVVNAIDHALRCTDDASYACVDAIVRECVACM